MKARSAKGKKDAKVFKKTANRSRKANNARVLPRGGTRL